MSSLLRFSSYLRPYGGRLAGTLGLNVLFSLLSAASIYVVLPILSVIFDRAGASPGGEADEGFFDTIKEDLFHLVETTVLIADDPIASLRNLCVLVVLLFLAKNVVKVASGVMTSVIQQGVMKDIRDDLYEKSLRLPVSYFNEARGGELISLVTNEVATLNAAILPTFVKLTRTPIEIITLLLLLLAISPSLTLVAFSTTILSIIVVRILRRSIRRYSLRMQAALENMTSRLQEGIQNIRIVKAFATEPFETDRFRNETGFYTKSAIKHSIVNNLSGPFGEVIAVIAIGVVIFYGGSLALEGSMAPEELVTFLLLLFSIMTPTVKLLQIPTEIQRGEVAAERLDGLLRKQPESSGTAIPPRPVSTGFAFENVRFSYVDGTPVLHDLSISIDRGQTVALVGASGSGKSTIADLLLRLYDPDGGQILLDGQDIRQFDTTEYRRLFGVVTQEPLLFHDSIAANIAYGDDSISREEIEKAATIANAAEFIEGLDDGYDTITGDRGLRLSGGQRQRIAIARAIARNPEVLIFDEATSALDGESETLVRSAIDEILVDRTAIVIAHRLSTIEKADRIVVIDSGRVVESGSHRELLARDGLYAAMIARA